MTAPRKHRPAGYHIIELYVYAEREYIIRFWSLCQSFIPGNGHQSDTNRTRIIELGLSECLSVKPRTSDWIWTFEGRDIALSSARSLRAPHDGAIFVNEIAATEDDDPRTDAAICSSSLPETSDTRSSLLFATTDLLTKWRSYHLVNSYDCCPTHPAGQRSCTTRSCI